MLLVAMGYNPKVFGLTGALLFNDKFGGGRGPDQRHLQRQ